MPARRARRAPCQVDSPLSLIEPLEARLLLSAANPVMHQGIVATAANVPASDLSGLTPTQVLKAYGMDQITFAGGQTPDGSGQTIAIVDPYNDPSVQSDLTVFDQQFDIAAPPSLQVVDQTGGTHLPQTNGSWAGEIATDVEWAHAVAPGAKILLVETNTDNTSDLMAGVNYAMSVSSVSVISLSWGGGEFASQTGYDPDFNTPAGHEGVTVLAAAGDNGAASGAQWPGSAPNVVAVGGTVLHLGDDSGTYGSETSWTSTSGGVSKFEKEPSFQEVAQRSGFRAMPDVSINADDNVGQVLYDSVPYQGLSGWQTTNGTSVGTPEWAGLVAIANQGRALSGLATLDGAGQTLPLLYSLYGAPGTSAYTSYTSYFNDITVPQNPNATNGVPTVGYDTTTGLGSPKAAAIVGALVTAPSAAELAAKLQTLTSQIGITLGKQPPTSAVGGAKGTVQLRVTNGGTSTFTGPIVVTLYASTDLSLLSNPIQITSITLPGLKLKPRATHPVKVTFDYPSVSTSGDYYLVATADSLASGTAPSEAASTMPIAIAPPFVKLSPVFTGNSLVVVKPGKTSNASVLIRNDGNVTAVGTVSVNLYESSDNTLDNTDTLLTTSATKKLNLRTGKNMVLRIPFPAPAGQEPGYFLIATITSSATTDTGTASIGTR